MSLTKDDEKIMERVVMSALMGFWDQVLEKKFDYIENNMATKEDLKETEKRLDQKIMKESQATCDYVVKVSNNKSGESMTRDHVLDEKINTTADTLGNKDIFATDEVSHIKNISPFSVEPSTVNS